MAQTITGNAGNNTLTGSNPGDVGNPTASTPSTGSPATTR